MRRISFTIACCILLIFTASGCGSGEQNPSPENPEVKAVAVTVQGYKNKFAYGEVFSFAGIKVSVAYDDATEEVVSPALYSIDSSKFNSYVPGDYEIIVTTIAEGLKTTYTVTVLPKKSDEDEPNEGYKKKLRILMIGNSFSEDVIEYAWNIAYELGVEELITANAYIGGASITTHASNVTSGAAAYSYGVNKSGAWSRVSGRTLKSIVTAEDWDVITMQQSSTDSGVAAKYGQNLYTVANFIHENATNSKMQLAWHMTWAYPKADEFLSGILHSSFSIYGSNQMQMYSQIVSTVNSVIEPSQLFYKVIPNGTMIQNLRTTNLRKSINRDDCHLSIPLGRFAGALALISTITEYDISKVSYRPANLTLSATDFDAIAKSVKSAIDTPYEVTFIV